MKQFATWALLFAIVLLSVLENLRDASEETEILQRAEQAVQQHNQNTASQEPEQSKEQSGVVYGRSSDWRFSTEQLQQEMSKIPLLSRHRFYTWSGPNKLEITGSASGVDKKTWFANSYLVGFKPFDTKTVWEPLATLALRKGYILDHQLYGPSMAEIWQNSRQAFKYSRGDCEDHAIILADWLIAMGYDARVALGRHRSTGHAWVILFIDDKEYILESTTKRRPKSINDFLLAGLATDYRPRYQFDRKSFWVNTGSEFTTKYRDEKWKLRSSFSKMNPTL